MGTALLTMQLIDPRAHKQHNQRQHQAAVHSEALPRIWNIIQILDGKNSFIRHYGQTNTSCQFIHSVCCSGWMFILLLMFSDVPTSSYSPVGLSCARFEFKVGGEIKLYV